MHPVLATPGLAGTVLRPQHLLAIAGIEEPREEFRLREPFVGRVAEDRLDLGAEGEQGGSVVRSAEVRDEREPLDESLVPPFGLTQLLAQSSALADIRGNRAARDQLARLVPNRTDRERNGDLAPIGSAMNELPVLDTFPASRSLDQLACLLGRVVCEEHRERPPDRLLRA